MRCIAAILGILAATLAADAAELISVRTSDNATIIALSGDIEDGDADGTEALIKTTNDDGRLVAAMRLDSLGGSLAEATKLAEFVRRAKLPTLVASRARCASACFIVFAAGIEKYASALAAIGVHGVSDRFGHQSDQTRKATLAMARLATSFGVPARIVSRMIDTRPDEIAWLSPDDLRAMGAIVIKGAERTPPPLSASSRGVPARRWLLRTPHGPGAP